MRVALYRDIGYEYEYLVRESKHGTTDKRSIRVTEWVDVEFPRLPDSELKLQYEELRVREIQELESRKAQLLSTPL